MRMPKSLVMASCAAALLAACGSAPKERFYTLGTAGIGATGIGTAGIGAAAGMNADYRVAVGPVSMPELVDRPQFVVRRGPNRVELLEQHRWAEPLSAQVARVLAADIGARLERAQVTSYGDYASRNADYRVAVDIERFEGAPGEAVTVQALWTLRSAVGQASRSGRAVAREFAGDGGYEALAAAYGRALAAVAGEIGDAVLALRASERR